MAAVKGERPKGVLKGVQTVAHVARNKMVMDALAKEGATVASVARDFGLSHQRISAIRSRELAKDVQAEVEKAEQSVVREMRRVSNEQAIAKLEDFVDRVLDSVGPEVIEKAGLKDRVIALGIAIDKRQLLKGEATVIFGADRRRKVDELLPALLGEARRRGVEITLEPGDYQEVKADE